MDIFSSKRFSDIYEKVKDQPRLSESPRIEFPSKKEFLNVLAPAGYPFISTIPNNAFRSWDQVRKIFKKYSEAKLKVRTGEYYRPENYRDRREYVDVTLQEYLEKIFSDKVDGFYAGNQPLPVSLWDELTLSYPDFYPRSDYEPPAFWLGPRGSITPLHKDSADNFAFHLLGRKKWLIYPVKDARHLYMKRAMDRPGSDFAPSDVDLTKPDLEKFPEINNAMQVSVVVEAGEVLYLPAGWGHFVENLEPSLMVNLWVSLNAHEPAVL
jgi:hypothetical protein